MSRIVCACRRASVLSLIVLCIATLAIFGMKQAIEYVAHKKSNEFVSSVTDDSMDENERIYAIANGVYESFVKSKSSNNPPLLFRLRPYLTNELLPSFLRVKVGAIDSIYIFGKCDSAARTLVHLLNMAGYEAWQFNYMSPKWAHSVVLALLPSGQTALLDPTYGVASYFHGRLITPEKAQQLQASGTPLTKIWRKFGDPSALKYYSDFDQAVMARQGEALKLEITVDLSENEVIQLGKINNAFGDVLRDASQHGWSRSWHYLGHRYDRNWERAISFPQRTRVTFVMTEKARLQFLTSQIAPTKVDGKTIIFEIERGGTLHFRDWLSKRDWLTLKSYQDIDSIVFEEIGE